MPNAESHINILPVSLSIESRFCVSKRPGGFVGLSSGTICSTNKLLLRFSAHYEDDQSKATITCTLNLTMSAPSDVPSARSCLHLDVEDMNTLFKSFKDIQIIY